VGARAVNAAKEPKLATKTSAAGCTTFAKHEPTLAAILHGKIGLAEAASLIICGL
jgi:hypothetical protein